jgi:hypothetical protein
MSAEHRSVASAGVFPKRAIVKLKSVFKNKENVLLGQVKNEKRSHFLSGDRSGRSEWSEEEGRQVRGRGVFRK